MSLTFYEFFAGGGMARLGLGPSWTCLFANDIDDKKCTAYEANFGNSEILKKDVSKVTSKDMPGLPDLAWASFPCQDLSLAGNREGLEGERSGTFWGFWSAINKLKAQARQPHVLVLENVVGTLTSHGGKDFEEIIRAVCALGYRAGAVVADAIDFLPQSRPRLFIICIKIGAAIPHELVGRNADPDWHSKALIQACNGLPRNLQSAWIWWRLPAPEKRTTLLADMIEQNMEDVEWHSSAQTAKLVGMMSEANRKKLQQARKNGAAVGAVYKRTRPDENGKRVQRAEVRFDGVAGCLRTPGGGSSRQTLIFVNGKQTRSRLMTVREAARLMGAPESYKIPANYNEGYHIFGDGLAVPVVRFLAANLLERLMGVVSAKCKALEVAAA